MEPIFKRPQGAPPREDTLCTECKKELTMLDIGLHKKMINRGATRYMCIDCLASYTELTREILLEKAEQFRKMGCILFR